MSALTFRELTLLDAERQLVGRCLTDRAALQASLEILPLDCWRSEQGQDLSRVYYALAGRLERGAYDPETNEDDLAAGLAAYSLEMSRDDLKLMQARRDRDPALVNAIRSIDVGRQIEDGVDRAIDKHFDLEMDHGISFWRDYLDGLWCPWTAVPEYLAGIVGALVDAYCLQDGAVQAFRDYIEANPLTVSTDMEDDLYHRLRDVVVRRRELRFRKNVPDPSPPVDWEAIRARAMQ